MVDDDCRTVWLALDNSEEAMTTNRYHSYRLPRTRNTFCAVKHDYWTRGFYCTAFEQNRKKNDKTSCGAKAQQTPPSRIAASRGFSELTKNVIRSSRGHSTPSLKISCKSVRPFARNVADKEISIARFLRIDPKLNQVVPWSLQSPHLPWEFHAKQSSRFVVILLTKKWNIVIR